MSTPRPSARAKRTATGLLAVGAVVGGLLAATTPAGAAPQSELTRAATPLGFKAGRYVVVLREPGAASYTGGDRRFARTSPTDGGQLDGRSAAVRAYSDHLERTHRSLAAEVGATVALDYTVALNGFAAQLSGAQAAELSSDRRVALVSPDRRLKLDTWHTPTFLGLTGRHGEWAQHGGRRDAGAGTVVGIIDSGIWPESRSFAGKKLTDTPKTRFDIRRRGAKTFMDKADGVRFEGRCQTGVEFTYNDCSTKLVGARYYPDIFAGVSDPSPEEYLSPRDGDGHGSHTASTAAGRYGVRARVEGRDFGRISGMAPAARIAAYKVCYSDSDPTTGDCFTSASVAAINDAVLDGVDVINYSISGSLGTVIDPVELAFEGAAEAGIFVAASAGNSGPTPSTVAHNSPWVTTVAASTHISFENTVVLGNGKKLAGASIAGEGVPRSPLVDSTDVAAGDPADATLCAPGSLDEAQVGGTIVVCTRGVYDRVAKSAEVARAGGIGMILVNPTPASLDADFHSVPTVHLDAPAGRRVLAYVDRAGDDATAAIRLGNRTNQVQAIPQVASFSSRGPALANDSDILKPDLSAPGVSVLAAVAPPSNSNRRFDLFSGTSMASPHVAGLAAFVASQHPGWTPMEIKSAMMTTAKSLVDEDGKPIKDAFAQGAGNVRPGRFFDPGLFVTASARDWRGYLAGQGLPTGVRPIRAKNLNQPSMAAGQVSGTVAFRRHFVATMKGTWRVSVDVPGFNATVTRKRITSSRKNDILDLKVFLSRDDAPLGEWSQGFVTLTGPTTVRMPVAVRPVAVSAPTAVAGTGTSGSASVSLTAGTTGDLAVGVHGLAESTTDTASVNVGDTAQYGCIAVGADTRTFRVSVDSRQDDADLDLYVYKADDTCGALTGVAGQSATGSADEEVTLDDPEPGNYFVVVDGYTDGADNDGTMEFRLDVWDVNGASNLGDLTVDPQPVPVVAGQPTSYEVSWTGLDPEERYLGVLDYDGTGQATYVSVDTRTP